MIILLRDVPGVSRVVGLTLVEFAVVGVLSSSTCEHGTVWNSRSTLVIVELVTRRPLRRYPNNRMTL